jgi:pyrroline-5-carboxylate reductase
LEWKVDILGMKITIFGFGNMGSLIGYALSDAGHEVFAYDKNNIKIKKYKNIKIEKKISSLKSKVVIIAVKPKDVAVLASEIKEKMGKDCFLISIAAGVTIKELKEKFGCKKIVRTMPNLGVTVGEGIIGWKSEGLGNKEKSRMKKILDGISENFEVGKESDLDAVTAISGSGPAYFFYLAKCLLEASKNLGMSQQASEMMVKKTFAAAAKLAEDGNLDGLIAKVASKGGTTEAAVKVFKKMNLEKIVNSAVIAAYKKAVEIGFKKG